MKEDMQTEMVVLALNLLSNVVGGLGERNLEGQGFVGLDEDLHFGCYDISASDNT